MDARFAFYTVDYVSVPSECNHDCKYSERVKTDWKTKIDKWLEDDKREKEQKKREKEIYDLKVAKAEVARIKIRKEADLGRAYWQMHPLTTSVDKNDL